MSDDLDDLFGDGDEEQQAADQEDVLEDPDTAAADEAAYDASLEDDMDDAPAAGQQQLGDGLDADEERELFGGLDDEDEDAGNLQQEERGPPIDVRAPLLPRPPAGKMLLMKVPNIIRVDTHPYDPAHFDGGVEEYQDDKTGKIIMRPKDINVIRWRYRQGKDGQLQRESNARYVKWSDGSESIVLGDEVINLDRKDHSKTHTYLYAVRYDVIEGQAHLNTRLDGVPASIHSKLHKRLKMTVQQATQKVDKVRMHYAARNPEMEKAEAEKRAQEAAQLKAARERAAGRPVVVRKKPAFTAAYLEQDDFDVGGYDEDRGEEDAARDEELYRRNAVDEEEEAAAARRLRSAKRTTPPPAAGRKRPLAEEELGEADEPAAAAAEAPRLRVYKGAILDDDDD